MVRKRKSTPTIHDVAKAAGVSLMTVSRAMRGVDGVSERRRAEILRIAQKMNYTPNSAARSLAVTNADLIGISIPNLFNDVFADIILAMRRTFQRAGFSTVIDTTDFSHDAEEAFVQRLLTWRPSAVILTGTDHSERTIQMLKSTRVPTLETWDHTADPIDLSVGMDHASAGMVAAEYVRDLGYKRPAFVCAAKGKDTRAEKRLEGLRAVFHDSVIPVGRSDDASAFEQGFNGCKQVLDAHAPDVILFLNDHYAYGGMMACQEAGLRIPEDIGIVGFNNLGLARVMRQTMTTVSTPRREMGAVGAQHLLARINGVAAPRSHCLPARMIPGATTILQDTDQ